MALTSAVFLLVASLTGIILAFEPMEDSIKPFDPVALNEVSLAESIAVLERSYDEVLSLSIDANDFVEAIVITKDGNAKTIYINPATGDELGKPSVQGPVYQFATNLHRSLFLKSVGRFFVGLISFLLCLIAVTGLLLIIKRQGGIRKLFSPIQKDYFELRYHVIVGRWALLPIIIVAATGVYLSAEKFSLVPSSAISHKIVEPNTEVNLKVEPQNLPIFQKITLDEVRSVNFPFSEMPEDYFEVALSDSELYVHQYTGEILSEVSYPFAELASRWSMTLHTGQGSIIWAIVLLLASISILFFIYSGLVMWRRRIKNTKSTAVQKDSDECSHIILVGSETGSTFAFAQVLKDALVNAGKKVFVAELNKYAVYPKAEHLIVLTATYGEGESPTNASNFIHQLKSISQERSIRYSVVGFGSLVYPDYCQFAIEVDEALSQQQNFKAVLPLYKINNQSFSAFKDWAAQWSEKTRIPLELKRIKKKERYAKPIPFEVAQRTDLNVDETFLLQLKPRKNIKFQSGDLLAYQPSEKEVPRLYSIAKVGNDILLSIRNHEFGVCSNYFSQLEKNEEVRAAIKRNHEFHFPKDAKEIVCISNGTGIAPFLGLIDENEKQIPIDLFWGGRTKKSFEIYQSYVQKALNTKKLQQFLIAYSQEHEEKIYVQDLIKKQETVIAQKLESGAVFMICGSIAMQREVLEVLGEIVATVLQKQLSDFEHNEQLKMDCY